MGSLLIIKNNYEIDANLRKQLEEKYRVYIAMDAWEGLDIIDDNYIDTFVIMSGDHIETLTSMFLKELYQERSKFTSIIFISEKPSETLQFEINYRGNWYFTPYPINHKNLTTMVENTIELANFLDDKGFVLEKGGIPFPYKVKNVSRIQRNRHRYIKIYSRNPSTKIADEEEFFYDAPLNQFPVDHGIEKFIKQAYQNWLVPVSEVKEVRNAQKEIVLTNGIIVPTSRKYIKNFQRKKTKK